MRTLLPILCLAATATAQSVTIPSIAITTQPLRVPFWTSNVFSNGQSRSQTIVDVNDVSVPAAVWNSLATRRPVNLGNANVAFTANATIVMSVSSMTWDVATTTYASNHGANQTTVVNGSISLPARANPPSWPAAFEAPFPFTAPFPYAKALGKSLVIDILQTGNTGASPWYVEATSPDLGGRAENGGPLSTCKFSNGNYNNTISYFTNLLPGAQWFVNYGSLLPNAIGVGAIGVKGVGQSWNGIPLKLDLGPLGAPGCAWNVSVEYMIGLTVNASGNAQWPNQNVPNDPSLAGGAFYDHAAFIDPAANALGLVTTWSSKWNIGTQIGTPGSFVSGAGAAAVNPTGTLQKGFMPTLQLNP